MAKSSLFLFNSKSRLRKACVWLVKSVPFKIAVLLMIVLNTLILGIYDHSHRLCTGKTECPLEVSVITKVSHVLDYVFAAFFLLEFLLKVIAMGFVFEKYTYLRDPWNVLDFTVVIDGCVFLVLGDSWKINILRIFRTIRLLNYYPPLRRLIKLVLVSIPSLVNACLFLSLFITILATVGMQLFSGDIERRCRLTEFPINGYWPISEDANYICGSRDCPQGTFCGAPDELDFYIERNNSEIDNEDLVWGIVNFDSFPNASITLFTSLTAEGWTINTYLFADGTSPIVSMIFFTVLIVVGTFFLLNLVLAILYNDFHNLAKKSRSNNTAIEREASGISPILRPSTYSVTSNDQSAAFRGSIMSSFAAPPKLNRLESIRNITGGDETASRQSVVKALTMRSNDVEDIEHESIDVEFLQLAKETMRRIHNKESSSPTKLEVEFEPSSATLPQELKIIAESSNTEEPELTPQGGNANRAHQVTTSFDIIIAPAPLSFYSKCWQLLHNCLAKIWTLYRRFCSAIVENMFFTPLITLLIITNLIILTLYRYSMSIKEEILLDNLNTIFTCIFLGELILRVSSVGFRTYFKLKFNVFDAIIVVSSVAAEIYDYIQYDQMLVAHRINSWNVLRAVRVFRLANGIPPILRFLKTFKKTVKDLTLFILLIVIFMMVCAVCGEELFAYRARFTAEGKVAEDRLSGESPRINFDTFLQAFLTQFALLANDDWNTLMYRYIRTNNIFVAEAYFLIVLIIGNFILLRLFIAILISTFEEATQHVEEEDLLKKQSRRRETFTGAVTRKFGQLSLLMTSIMPKTKDKSPEINNPSSRAQSQVLDVDSDEEEEGWLQFSKLKGYSFNVFKYNNTFRLVCSWVTSTDFFEGFITLLGLTSLALVALENPFDDPESFKVRFLIISGEVIQAIFIIEFLMRCIADGVYWNGPGSYLRDKWRLLDSIVILVSTCTFLRYSFAANGFAALIFRIIRATRVIRLILLSQGMRAALLSIIFMLPTALKLTLVCSIFYSIFAVFAVQHKRGAFFFCDMTNIEDSLQGLIDNKWDCLDYGGDWVNGDRNFDNFPNAMLVLFQLSTTEGWMDIMWEGVDSRGRDLQPQKDANRPWILFYVCFVVFGSFFAMNLFSAVVVDSYHQEHEKIGELASVSKEQAEWLKLHQAILRLKPNLAAPVPQSYLRKVFYNTAKSRGFIIASNAFLIINGISGMLVWTRQPGMLADALNYIQLTIRVFFLVELTIKLMAYGLHYFKNPWNTVDFVLIIIVWLLTISQITTSHYLDQELARGLCFLRLVGLFRRLPQLQIIFKTLLFALPSLVNIFSLLIIVMCLYAVVGITMFSFVKLQSELDFHANFQDFKTTMFTLLRLSTGENWDWLMADLSRSQQPNFVCVDYDFTYENLVKYGVTGCGTRVGALIYCLSFQFLYTMIVLNLFIAVILKVFEDEAKEEGQYSLSNANLEMVKEAWMEFDPDATALILVSDFEAFLDKLRPPLGWDTSRANDLSNKLEFIKNLELKVYDMSEKSEKTRLSMRRKHSRHNMECSPKPVEEEKEEEKQEHGTTKRRRSTRRCQKPEHNEFAYYYFHEVVIALSKKALVHKTSNFFTNVKVITVAQKLLKKKRESVLGPIRKKISVLSKLESQTKSQDDSQILNTTQEPIKEVRPELEQAPFDVASLRKQSIAFSLKIGHLKEEPDRKKTIYRSNSLTEA